MFFTINEQTAVNSDNITCIGREGNITTIYFVNSQNITVDMDDKVHKEMIDMLKRG